MTSRIAVPLTALLLAGGGAQAHLLPRAQGTLNLRGADAYVMLSVPVSALSGADDDGDRLLSAAELARHHAALRRQIAAGFMVRDGGRPGTSEALLLLPEGAARAADLIVLQHTRFAAPPDAPEVETSLFADTPAGRQVSMRVVRGADTELAVLTPDVPSRRLFLGFLGTLRAFIGIGIRHILAGPDHLLFLMTVVGTVGRWRDAAAIVTAFTVAHSITLTLSALNLVRVPAAITEPAIAASIVAMALLTLAGGRRGGPPRIIPRIAAVFGCGLLHGLGFAAALGDMALDGSHRVATLLGFNLGVEAGQALFLLGLAAIAGGLHRVRGLTGNGAVIRHARLHALPAVAAAAGAVMLVQRLAAG